jgi:hypothetical protein
MFDRKIQKNCGSVRVTTSEFVLSVSKYIDLCKLKVDPNGSNESCFLSDFWGHRIRPTLKWQCARIRPTLLFYSV